MKNKEHTFDFSIEIEGFDIDLRAHYLFYPDPTPAEIEVFKLEVDTKKPSIGMLDVSNLLEGIRFDDWVNQKVWEHIKSGNADV